VRMCPALHSSYGSGSGDNQGMKGRAFTSKGYGGRGLSGEGIPKE